MASSLSALQFRSRQILLSSESQPKSACYDDQQLFASRLLTDCAHVIKDASEDYETLISNTNGKYLEVLASQRIISNEFWTQTTTLLVLILGGSGLVSGTICIFSLFHKKHRENLRRFVCFCCRRFLKREDFLPVRAEEPIPMVVPKIPDANTLVNETFTQSSRQLAQFSHLPQRVLDATAASQAAHVNRM